VKNSKKILIFIFSICLCFEIYFPLMAQQNKKIIVSITIPKSGTNLLSECLCMITGKQPVFVGHSSQGTVLEQKLKKINPKLSFFNSHLIYTQYDESILNNFHTTKFFMYRDPRDQIVSFAYYMIKSWPHVVQNLSFDEIIMLLIKSKKLYIHWPNLNGIAEFYRAFLPWKNSEEICIIRFEDLVGPQGGSSDAIQFKTIKKIVTHLGLDTEEKKIRAMAQNINDYTHKKIYPVDKVVEYQNNLFGGSPTFRSGQIGAWRNNFKEAHKIAFKEVAGQLLIDLGYEKDFDW